MENDYYYDYVESPSSLIRQVNIFEAIHVFVGHLNVDACDTRCLDDIHIKMCWNVNYQYFASACVFIATGLANI